MKKIKIDYSIFGVGNVRIDAKNAEDAIRQFDDMDMKELAGWCRFSSFDESGIHIISIDGQQVQADLWDVKRDMGVDDDDEEDIIAEEDT